MRTVMVVEGGRKPVPCRIENIVACRIGLARDAIGIDVPAAVSMPGRLRDQGAIRRVVGLKIGSAPCVTVSCTR